jgi:hypothetical protein
MRYRIRTKYAHIPGDTVLEDKLRGLAVRTTDDAVCG